MDSLTEKLRTDIIRFLAGIDARNFVDQYDNIKAIILSYRDLGMPKEDVLEILLQLEKEDLNDGQDELLLEMSCRLEGFCTPKKVIEW